MPQLSRAMAKDHTSAIGAALSVAFMSLSIAGALALINTSTPAQSGAPRMTVPAQSDAPVVMALPADKLQGSSVSISAAAQHGEARSDPKQAAQSMTPASLLEAIPGMLQPILSVAQLVSPAMPTPPVSPTRVIARRPARHEVSAEPVVVLPVQARVHPRPPLVTPPRIAQSREPPVPGLITPSMLRHLSAALKLTSEQRALYVPLEQALLAIGAQQVALVRAGQDPKDAFSIGTAMSMYGVAQPFLNTLREDQKARVRAEARNMGFGSVAAQI